MSIRNWWLARRTAVAAARGMTLLEIMVVIAIIGIVATAVSVGVVGALGRAKVNSCKIQISTIRGALTRYNADNGDYPSQLSALIEGGQNAYIEDEKKLKDPWNNEFLYNYPSQKEGRQYDLCSKGPDKREGTEDDICNE
jgi:general secretion pathway protein G